MTGRFRSERDPQISYLRRSDSLYGCPWVKLRPALYLISVYSGSSEFSFPLRRVGARQGEACPRVLGGYRPVKLPLCSAFPRRTRPEPGISGGWEFKRKLLNANGRLLRVGHRGRWSFRPALPTAGTRPRSSSPRRFQHSPANTAIRIA